jgi:hypothetical protein
MARCEAGGSTGQVRPVAKHAATFNGKLKSEQFAEKFGNDAAAKIAA